MLTPLNPTFINKTGVYRGIHYFSYLCSKTYICGYSLELPQRGSSDKYPQSMFWAEVWKISEFFIPKFSFFGGEILNIFGLVCFHNVCDTMSSSLFKLHDSFLMEIFPTNFEFYFQQKLLTRKMPNGIMDRFFQKGNQKINLGWHPTHDASLVITILKDGLL